VDERRCIYDESRNLSLMVEAGIIKGVGWLCASPSLLLLDSV
jgi:hypothetical protein